MPWRKTQNLIPRWSCTCANSTGNSESNQAFTTHHLIDLPYSAYSYLKAHVVCHRSKYRISHILSNVFLLHICGTTTKHFFQRIFSGRNGQIPSAPVLNKKIRAIRLQYKLYSKFLPASHARWAHFCISVLSIAPLIFTEVERQFPRFFICNSSWVPPFLINSTALQTSCCTLLNGIFRVHWNNVDQKVNKIVATYKYNPSSSKTLAVA